VLVFKNLNKKNLVANLKETMKREFGFVSFGRQADGTFNMVTSKTMLEEKLQKVFNNDSTISEEIIMAKTNEKKLAQQIVTITPNQLIKMAYSEDVNEEKISLKEIGIRVTRAQAVWALYNPSDKFKTKGDISDLNWVALVKAWDNEKTASDAEENVLSWMTLDTKLSKVIG